MQKGTVIESGVLHRDLGAESDDGAKLCAEFADQDRKNACQNPARNSKRETVISSVEDDDARKDDDCLEHSQRLLSRQDFHSADVLLEDRIIEAVLNDPIPSRPSIPKPKSSRLFASNRKARGGLRIGTFMSRVFAVVLAAVMTVSMAGLASDAMASTTPYTNIDVPLTTSENSGNVDTGGSGESTNAVGANNTSDNANPIRVETDDGTKAGKGLEAGILGPVLSPVSSRTSDDASNADAGPSDGDAYIDIYAEGNADTYIDGAYAYERIKDEDGENTGKVRLVKVDPTVGKVARIEANVTGIASGAFTGCNDLQTLIVFGNVTSIAKAEYDADDNLTQEGAFTDDQLKNTHVVFATTFLDEANSLHDTRPEDAGSYADASAKKDDETGNADGTDNADVHNEGNGGVADEATSGNGASNTVEYAEAIENGADSSKSATPVDEGIKRLSGDVMLSAPSIKDDKDNVWLQAGFENIIDTPQIGSEGTALEDSEGSDITYTLTSDYILEATWNGEGDMPVDLALPDYGQVDGTIYALSNGSSDGFGNEIKNRAAYDGYGFINITIAISPNAFNVDQIVYDKNYVTLDTSSPSVWYANIYYDQDVVGLMDLECVQWDQSTTEYQFYGSITFRANKTSTESTSLLYAVNKKSIGAGGFTFLGSDYHSYGILSDIAYANGPIQHSDGKVWWLFQTVTGSSSPVTVTFNGNGGVITSSASKTCYSGSIYGELPGATRGGYKFDGWYTAASGGTLVTSSSIVPSSNHTLYAHWSVDVPTYKWQTTTGGKITATPSVLSSPNNYKLVLKDNDNSLYFTSYDSSSYTIGYITPVADDGYAFSHWSTKADGSDEVTSSSISTYTGNVTLYAIFNRDVPTYKWQIAATAGGSIKQAGVGDASGGSTSLKLVVTDGNPVLSFTPHDENRTIGTLTPVADDGYAFSHWSTKADGSDPVTASKVDSYTGTVTLYPIFVKAVKYTWQATTGGKIMASSDISAAGYVENKQLLIYSGDDKIRFASYGSGNITGSLAPEARDGYHFSHWGTDADGYSLVDSSTDNDFTGEVCLYAIFRPDNSLSWSVIGEGSISGSGLPSGADQIKSLSNVGIKIDSSGRISLYNPRNYNYGYLAPAPNANHHFSHWTTNADGTGKYPADEVTFFEGDITLYAVFVPDTITVTTKSGTGISATSISASGNTVSSGTATVSYDTSVTIDATVKAGYTWKNWTGSATTTTKRYTFTSGTSDVTFTANATANTNTQYKVEHYQMTTSGTYPSTPTETVTETGTTDTTVNAEVKSYTGFTYDTGASNVASGKIAGDGTLVLKLYYKRNSYTMTLSAANAAGTSAASCTASNGWTRSSDGKSLTKSYMYGTKLGTLPSATRSGYAFEGWRNSSAELVGTMTAPTYITADTTVTGNATYTAVWSFTVSYNGNGYTSGTVPATTTYYTGSSGSASHTVSTATPTRTNYSFYGWLDSDIAGTATAPTRQTGTKAISGNKTYYAAWSFSVRYSAANATGSVPASTTCYTGSSGTASITASGNALTRTHYAFAGWRPNSDYTGSGAVGTLYAKNATISAARPTDDVNKAFWLYATWSFSVSYSTNAGSDTVTLASGTAPAKQTLYAGASGSSSYSPSNATYTRRGYQFGQNAAHTSPLDYTDANKAASYPYKWNTRANGSGTWYTGGQSITITPTDGNVDNTSTNIVLYGQWTLWNYIITYDLSGGEAQNSTHYSVTTPSFAVNAPVRLGYDFSPGIDAEDSFGQDACGWSGNYNASAKEGQAGYSMARTSTLTIHQGSIGNITLTANWHLHKYWIRYNNNGDKLPLGKTNPRVYTIESSALTITAPEWRPYTFSGWTIEGVDPKGTQIDAGTAEVIIRPGTAGNLTFTAGWNPFNYEIQFDGNGATGGTTPSITTTYGDAAGWSAPACGYTREGFEFDSWNTRADGRGTSYEPGKTYKDNLAKDEYDSPVTLYATWTANPYFVEFDKNASDAVGSMGRQTMYCGQSATLSANTFTRTGYVFAGWSDIPGEGQVVLYADRARVTDLETIAGRTHTLYACWTPITYTVQFNSNAPSGKQVQGTTATQQLTYNAPMGLNENGYIIEGYTFGGWTLNSAGTGTVYDNRETIPNVEKGIANLSARADALVILYAQWSPNTYTVTYHKNAEGNGGRPEDIEGDDLQYSTHTYDEWKALTKADELGWAWIGHTFKGWYTEANLSGTLYADGQRVQNLTSTHNANVDLYSKWEPNQYRITLDFKGGTHDATQSFDSAWRVPGGTTAYRDIEYGQAYCNESGMPKLVRTGYVFDGWFTADGTESGDWGDQIENADKVFFTGLADQTLYAKWSPIHFRVEYRKVNSNNQSTSNLLHVVEDWTYDRDITLLAYEDEVNQYSNGERVRDFHDANYIVTGWKLTPNSQTGAQFNCGQTVSPEQLGAADPSYKDGQGRIIIPIYIAQGLGSYLFTYYPDLESAEKGINQLGEPLSKSIGDTIDFRNSFAELVNPGHELTHWYLPQVKGGNNRFTVGERMVPVADIIGADFEHGDRIWIIPVWQTRSVRVTFDNGDGSEPRAPLELRYGEALNLSSSIFNRTTGVPTLEHCKFEGYWTDLYGQGQMLYNAAGRPSGENLNLNEAGEAVSASWNYVPDGIPDEGTIEIKLYAKWTTEVSFEYPYGGSADFTRSYILGAKYSAKENLLNDEWVRHEKETGTAWEAGLPVPGAHVDGYAFAGWYDAAQKGSRLLGDEYVDLGKYDDFTWWEPLHLYGCWKIDVTFDYPTYPEYSSAWSVLGQNLLTPEDGKGKVRIEVIQGQTYTAAGNLPVARRAGYKFIAWNEARGEVRTPEEGGTSGFGEDSRAQNSDVVTHQESYTLYLEYALDVADILVERWVEDIGGGTYTHVESGASGTAGAIARGEGVVGDAAPGDTAHTLGTEHRIAADGYKADGPSAYYTGFTYERMQVDSTKDGVENTDGRVAGDGTTVVRMYFSRNTHTLALADFKATDEAGNTHVRGVAFAVAEVTGASAQSPGAKGFGVEGDDESTCTIWYDQRIDVNALADAGYRFASWSVRDAGGDVPAASAGDDADASHFHFVAKDSDVDVAPVCEALDVEYTVESYFETLEDATHSTGEFVWDDGRGADRVYTAKADTLTNVVAGVGGDDGDSGASDASGASSNDPVEAVSVAGFEVDRIEVEDPSGTVSSSDHIENTVVKGDGSSRVKVFYKRLAYKLDLEGTRWADVAKADDGGAEAELHIYDENKYNDATSDYGDFLEPDSVDDGEAYGRQTYTILYEAPIRVVARANAYCELTGFDSSDANGIDTGEHGEVLGLDSQSLLDRALDVPEDTDGLPQWDSELPYYFEPSLMPARDVSISVQAQPVRASYISRYLFQDTDPESETDPADTYTLNRSEEMDGDVSYGITVTRTPDDARYLRYWIDGTDAEDHKLDGTDASMDAAQRGDLEVPPTSFEPSTAADAITSLARLTPEGNETIDGVPANVVYSRYDRKRHEVTYTYAGGPNESANQRPDGTSAPATIESYFGATVKVADTPQVSGWAFDGWMWMANPDADRDDHPYVGQGTDSESVTVPDFDVAITGTWSALPYTLTYDGGTAEGTPKSPMSPTRDAFGESTIFFNSEWQVSDVVPERPGYTFVGWTFADKAIFEAVAGGPIDLATGDVDGYRAALAAMSDLDGNPLLLEPGQTQVWTWHKGDRTLHAVWMRNSYNVTFDLGDGGWPTGTTVPLTYMTGAEVKVPQPANEGYAFTGWEVACDGSALDGDAPAVSYTGGEQTRAVINAWAYGDIAFTAKYEVRRFSVNLNPAGGTFDGEPADFMGKDIEYSSPNEEGAYGQATVYIPYRTEITSTTPLPEPTRPGYDFAGWTDAEGNPVGWMLGDDGNRVDVPYTFDGAREETWVATWRAHRYKVTYDLGEYAGSVTINGMDRFSEYFAGMTDGDGNAVTSFMLPTADDIEGLPDNVGFDGWYPQGGEPEDLVRSFDPNAETGDRTYVARFSTGANVYTERFWLEVLDQSEDVEGRQYASIGDIRFMLDETLSVTRRTNSPNAQASMSAITGFTSVNPYDGSGVSIYPTEHPYVCVFSAGQSTVNGFYTREAHALTVGTANGIEDDETLIQVSPASALVRDEDAGDGAYAVDTDENIATLKGVSGATVKWGAKVDVGVTCPRETGYAFVAWQTDAGATPADIDVRANPAAFTMPDADVVLAPTTELIRFSATYKDIFGKDVPGAGQATFTVLDSFALANLDDIPGYTFRGWEAYVADADGNKLDPAANPVPDTVGYDDAQEYMRVREGTATDLLFEARYAAIEYTVSVALPKGTSYLPSGMPDGLPQVEGVEWVLMPGDDGTDAIGFTYTVEDLSDPLVIDLTGISCAPYKVDGWTVAGQGGEASMPELSDGVLTLTNANLGDWNLTPDVSPIRYTLTLDLSDVRDGYVPLDIDEVKAELEAAGYEVRDGDKPGTLDVTFDVETADPYMLPTFGKEDDDSTPEYAFRGWAKDGDGASASNPYILPPSDIASWPESGTVIAPVWAKAGERSTLVAHLPNEKGEYTDDYTFAFTGDALTPIDYAQDGRFADIVNDVDGTNVGYHLVWHSSFDLGDDSVTTLPTNFPEQGTQEVWGTWVEDDDIITVGFGVKWDNSAPPGETKPRSVFALNANDVAAYSDDEAGTASVFSMRSAYSDEVAAIDETTDGDAAEAPVADANSTYYYIPNRGLYTKDANGKYHIVTRIANINDIAGSYAGWRLEGFYLPIDTADPKRIIIGPDGTVDNATFVEVAGSKPSDLTFTVRWARISLVEVNMVGGYGEDSEDITFFYWPEKDVFVKGDDSAIGDAYSAPRTYAKDDFNTGVMLDTFAAKGIPGPKEDADGTRAFIGYFGETSNGRWDYAKDAEGAPLPAADALTLTASFSYLAITGDYKKQATVGTGTVTLPYGYDASDDAQAYDPASADGATKVTWRAAWEGDLDAVYFNATVPMSMSFMVRPDGTAIGPDAGAYQIRNYSNTAISVEDMSFEWADESELEALFGKGATDALTLSATPTAGQDGYAQTRVLLERSKATQDAVGAGLISRYVFGADKWVIAKSVGMDPGDFTGDASILPALRLDYGLTAGGIRQLTQENASEDTTHPIGTLKFTLKTVR